MKRLGGKKVSIWKGVSDLPGACHSLHLWIYTAEQTAAVPCGEPGLGSDPRSDPAPPQQGKHSPLKAKIQAVPTVPEQRI